MNINLTLIGQSIAFFVFVWFCMKYVWPPIMNALDERKKTIADGLAAAERGMKEQELGQKKASQIIAEAKSQAQDILTSAEKRRTEIIEEAKNEAKDEGERILLAAQSEIEQQTHQAREALRGQLASLVITGAGQILEKEIDGGTHDKLLDDLVTQL
ncbi:MAG: F0F1 ATP synthase subunit B [Gammaproteobacteria bacterium]|nr:F0F1 ATP synthase subunit B [Gammaproteobacteria bacterium]